MNPRIEVGTFRSHIKGRIDGNLTFAVRRRMSVNGAFQPWEMFCAVYIPLEAPVEYAALYAECIQAVILKTKELDGECGQEEGGDKHTPGPWEAVDSLTIRGPFCIGDPSRPGWLIAGLPANIPEAERVANARLIAAAPELLEALQAIEVLFTPLARDSTAATWIDKARAAIAKAAGQEGAE